MAKDFQYHPLPDNRKYFRLLELLPGSFHDTLKCRLQETSLTSVRAYEAVSYVWRVFHSSHDSTTIICDDESLSITRNLQLALRYMRYETKSRWLWADAICINQRDLNERTAQVQCMRMVYSKASKVIFWLGLVRFDAVQALRFLDQIATLCPQAEGDNAASYDFEKLDGFLAETPPGSWDSLRQLLQVSLFSRIWVVQEFNLASDGDLFACNANGKLVQMRLERFKKAAFWIRKRRPVYATRFKIPWGQLDPYLYLSFFHDDPDHPNIPRAQLRDPVHFVLRSVRECYCTEPHDKIYALLGHCSLQTWCDNVAGRTQISVDYARPFSELYLAVGCRLLEEPQPLLTLSLVEHGYATWSEYEGRAASSLPTWVPNWQISQQSYFLPNEFRPRYSAATFKNPSFHITGRNLKIQGSIIDRITWTSEIMTLETYEAGLVENQPDAQQSVIRGIWNHLKESTTDAQNVLESSRDNLIGLCHVLNAGSRMLSEQTNRPKVSFDERLADLLAVLTQLGASLPGFDSNNDQLSGERGDITRFLTTTQALCRGRRFFITEKGFTCIGPSLTADGDKLCILYGAQVPFVVNELPVGDNMYRLCGESYAHGIMNSEAIALLAKKEMIDTELTLV